MSSKKKPATESPGRVRIRNLLNQNFDGKRMEIKVSYQKGEEMC